MKYASLLKENSGKLRKTQDPEGNSGKFRILKENRRILKDPEGILKDNSGS
jgi:hypothetical protein